MENDSYSATFTLTAFGEMDNLKYLYGCCALLGYLIIIFMNLTLFVVIVHEESLHEPMYIFIGNLAINGLYGTTAFFPKLIADLMSEKQTISHVGCVAQVFFLHTFAAFEFYTLALMAFDRYVAICNPLRYAEIMNSSTVFKLIVAAWTVPACVFGINVCLTIRLPLCGSIIEKVYCQIWSVLKLSCIDASINFNFGSFVNVINGLVPAVFILFSYLFIIKTSVRASKEARGKAMQTCAPHLLTFLNYIVAVTFEISQHYFDRSRISNVVRVLFSVELLVIPPLLNPIIYGLRTKEINMKLKKLFTRATKIFPLNR
ncbi:olfactory receptor 2K2-like [Latimeria chalumnae]|uniref:olfactory receptor 2K2-like n=1 Tax=Latimeria chalumnae TaxID=7897 RepID=UPI0003C16542|nr:PREDICTED: olfactory receptor 2K2-like [Latimeria chalumnae]|eukprot:XP_006011596.1 PREDICTED: olfactory receptor 2K2-like [Latimeria chalumnae]